MKHPMKFYNLKKAAAAFGLILGLSANAQAQGPYAKLGLGYQFGMGGTTEAKQTGTQVEGIKLNYGKGLTGNLALGYMFSPNIGAELGFGYLTGRETEVQSVFNNRVENNLYSSRMFLLTPALVISAGKEGLNPYAKFGLIAAKGKVVHEMSLSQNGILEVETHQTGGWGLGLQAALGLEFGLTEQLGFFTELNMNNLSYSPEKAEIVAYRYNGADYLPTLSVRARETTYVDTYNTEQTASGAPRAELKENLPFSSIGLQVGVKFNF